MEFENENTHLDFKLEEYTNNEKLVKDIMAMANASYNKTSYIIIGVKAEPGMEKEIVGLEHIQDQANLENVIQENIEPVVNFKYYPFIISSTLLGIIEIFGNLNPPYMMRKDFGSLKKGDMWIRKGSRQSRLTREDLDALLHNREKYILSDKIVIGFDSDLTQKKHYDVLSIDTEKIPSRMVKKKYQEYLAQIEEYSNINGGLPHPNKAENQNPVQIAQQLFAQFNEFNAEEKSIRVGHNEFGLPIYNTKEDLHKKIDNVERTYSDDDYFFYFEENSIKLNFCVLNDGNKFLEDVEFKFWFDKTAFTVAERKPSEPNHKSVLVALQQKHLSIVAIGYPEVKEEADNYLVKAYSTKIRHKEITPIFRESLRVLVRKNMKGTFSIPYQISAKNLPKPIKGNLVLEIMQ